MGQNYKSPLNFTRVLIMLGKIEHVVKIEKNSTLQKTIKKRILESMETNSDYSSQTPPVPLKEDRQTLMWTHLSQLLNYFTGFGGIIVPIILWQMKKDEIQGMDEQGKEIVNFQISLFIYAAVGTILTFILVGIIVLIAVGIIGIVFPIIQGINAKDGKPVKYPLTIRLLK
jgi:uncharacterized Tic20 family protein